jgi:hypothetical protein
MHDLFFWFQYLGASQDTHIPFAKYGLLVGQTHLELDF